MVLAHGKHIEPNLVRKNRFVDELTHPNVVTNRCAVLVGNEFCKCEYAKLNRHGDSVPLN
jgi:hypothetical protein